MSLNDIYPRKDDKTTIYLKNVITKQDIIVGDYTCLLYTDVYKRQRLYYI